MFAAFLKALSQLNDPVLRRPPWLGVALAAVVFIVLWALVGWLLTGTTLFAWGWFEVAAGFPFCFLFGKRLSSRQGILRAGGGPAPRPGPGPECAQGAPLAGVFFRCRGDFSAYPAGGKPCGPGDRHRRHGPFAPVLGRGTRGPLGQGRDKERRGNIRYVQTRQG